MAADLAVCPVTYWPEGNLLLIFCQPKTVLYGPSIKACLDDLIGCPGGDIRNKNVLTEAVDVPADPVMVLPEIHSKVVVVIVVELHFV